MQFISKYENLRLVIQPKRWKEVDGSKFLTDGITVEFRNGVFDTEDKELITSLKGCRSFGQDFWSAEGEKDELPVAAAKDINDIKEFKEKTESQCEICGKKFDNKQKLAGHMLSHKKKE